MTQPVLARAVHRRRFLADVALRGLGVSIGLPLLASRRPAVAAADTAPPLRMAFVYVPNGVNVARWRPQGEGREYALGASLAAVQPFRDDLQVISGLAHRNGFAGPDGAGDHARASATILTGARPRKTAGDDIQVGISVDQLAAARVGGATRLPSLELACDVRRPGGECDSGYACAYSFNISWRSARQPATPEANPRLAFERLFGAGTGAERGVNLARRRERERSILDFVTADARTLRGQLDAADRRKLDEYLDGIRAVERRIDAFEAAPPPPADVAAVVLPDRPPAAYAEHVRLMIDVLVLAFRSDATRIATLMLGHDGNNRPFPELGAPEGHHTLSHHQGDPAKLEKIAAIDGFFAEQFAHLLDRLRSATEADGRPLLDHSMVVYASGLSDGHKHRHDDLPVILAGRGGGRLAAGRHLRLPAERPMANLFVTLLDCVGAPERGFGDSTGPLDEVRG